MIHTKQIGDRIFYEHYDGSIGTALITDIKDAQYTDFDQYGKPLKKGQVFKFKKYYTSQYETIEDYNCLSKYNPKVREFCKGKNFITKDFVDEIRQWLTDKGCQKGDTSVSQILYSLAEEYE